MSKPVLQNALPDAPWIDPNLWRLPGIKPLLPAHWLMQDDAFAGQMALRDALLNDRSGDVHAMLPSAMPAALECLETILSDLSSKDGYSIESETVVRPDGHRVTIDRTVPLRTIGHLIQEDVCLLEKNSDGEHILTGAVLCFPASWTLSEKIGRPLTRLHQPVPAYTDDVAIRVQRMFDAIRPETLLWRANALIYEKPDLFSPKREAEEDTQIRKDGQFLRSERQTLRRLPETAAVVFTIHTFVVALTNLTAEQTASLDAVRKGHLAS